MGDQVLREALTSLLGDGAVTFSPHHNPDDLHDETLHPDRVEPFAVAYPSSTEDVAAIARLASRHQVPITPRGSGTGLSGGATPVKDGIVVSFARMNDIRSIDERDHVVVVQPGVILRDLDDALRPLGLRYPVYPGETSGSLGGNVNTNAGGMRAVRHGVTRQHVLGLELVLIDGTVMRVGGPVMKSSSGYDLTQLIVGSEGTLAMVTEVTLRLSPRFDHTATVLVPFADLTEVTSIVPRIVASGLEPSILEYLDLLTMAAITKASNLELGVAPDVVARTSAYLVIVLETRTAAQLDNDLADLADLVESAGALDVYVLPGGAAARLIEARERVFWVSKAAGANEIIDVVVPRSRVPEFLERAQLLGEQFGAFVAGCGHVGDGNVHLSIFQDDHERRGAMLHELFAAGLALGGQISGEHGIGRDKQAAYLALSDPNVLALQRRLKQAFDPSGLLNPFRHLDDRVRP